jgi:hypothetical protein
MDYAYQGVHPPPQLATMVAHSNVQPDDSPWYADSAANRHLTLEIENFQLTELYISSYSIVLGNDSSLQIENIGSFSFLTPTTTLHLS